MDKSIWTPHGLVTSPHHLATQTAVSVLREGATAMEAVVAAAAVLTVVYPHMNGIGGDGFWLIHPPLGDPLVIEACGSVGSLANRKFFEGYSSIPRLGPKAAITVAGTVGGWQEALNYSLESGYHTMSVSKLLSDAIKYAEHGFPVSRSLQNSIKMSSLKAGDEFKNIFMPNGRIPKIGEKISLTKYAETLKHLANNGLNSFYRGDLAKNMSKDMAALGMPITEEDLENYRPERKTPLQLSTKNITLYNTPPPTQGLASLIILGILDKLNIDTSNEGVFIHNVVEATKLAFEIKENYITDPAYMTVDPKSFLTDEYLSSLAERIDQNNASYSVDTEGAGDTIWMGVMDNKGYSVSYIQSLYHEFGSKVILPNSGIIWHNRGTAFKLDDHHIRALKPGKKPFHTLNPAAAKLSDGRIMVYGTRGGGVQPQTQAAIFHRYAKQGVSLQKSVSKPRWLFGSTYDDIDDRLHLENRFSAETLAYLRKRGHKLNMLPEFADEMGYAGILVRHPDGMMEGSYDPRSDGSVAGF